MSLNETRLGVSITDAEINFSGYSLIRCDRNRSGGGVLLAIKNSFTFEECICGADFGIEASSAKLSLGSKSVVVFSIYRPPSSDIKYFNNVVFYMEKILSLGYDTVFMGDFNLDMKSNGIELNKIKQICNILNLEQLVNSATRVTPYTSSCIDLIFTNVSAKHSYTNVLPISFSDHFLTVTAINFTIPDRPFRFVRKRSYKNFISADFIQSLIQSEFLSKIYSFRCVEKAWHAFKIEFARICNLHAPILHHKDKLRESPWMTKDILNVIKRREYLHKVAIQSKDAQNWQAYKSARNIVTNYIRKKKKEYFRNSVVINKNNISGMWKSLRYVLPSKKSCYMSNDITSNKFNSFFTSVGTDLTKRFSQSSLPDISFEKPECSFSFSEITPGFVHNYIDKLPNNYTMDDLEIDNKLLKEAATVICPFLSFLFNLSIATAIVPKDWKSALVTPIYKGTGPQNNPSNYRPISVLPTIVKIFESAIKLQVTDYIERNNLISPRQFAYLRGRSTRTALHSLVDKLVYDTDYGCVSAVCTIDMAKGFDTIPHNVLIHKLSFYGFSKLTVNWFESYLNGRFQRLKTNGNISSELPINIGVPQGSILGPILFILYINDLHYAFTDNCTTHGYADDTSLSCHSQSINKVQTQLQSNLDICSKWLHDNKLTVNASKSQVMLVGPKCKIQDKHLTVYLNNTELQQSSSIKLLGINVDSYLNWKPHVESVISKVSVKVGLLHRLSRFLPSFHLKCIYTAVVQSCFDYAITIWGSCFKTYLLPLQRLQNRCARICSNNFNYEVPSSVLIKNLNWMNIRERYFYFLGILMYKIYS